MPSLLLSAVREFAHTIVNPYDPDELLHRVVDHVTAVVPSRGAGIMLVGTDGELGFAVASDEQVTAVEQHQDHVSEGVCHDAFTTDQVVVSDDLVATDRYPEYAPRAVGLGFRAVAGTPMVADGQTIGALNVYRGVPGPWSEEDLEACEVLASMAAAYLLRAVQLRAAQTLAEQLQHALDARIVIEQAKGVLMATHDLDAAAARDALRLHARSSNRRLLEVAQQVIERTTTAVPRSSSVGS
jgi:GAF domain-containing protein